MAKAWDRSPFTYSAGTHETTEVALTSTSTYSAALIDPQRWSGRDLTEASVRYTRHGANPSDVAFSGEASLGAISASRFGFGPGRGAYSRAVASLSRTVQSTGGRTVGYARLFASYAPNAPREREVYASASDPTSSFGDDLWRPRGGVLAPGRETEVPFGYRTLADGHYRPLGGAALRGYDPRLVFGSGAAVNLEEAVRLTTLAGPASGLALYASVFGDAGLRSLPKLRALDRSLGNGALADAGPSVSVRGQLYDREVRVRADFPLFVRGLGVGDDARVSGARFRFAFSLDDLW